MDFVPSAAQLERFAQRPGARPVALFYQYSSGGDSAGALGALAARHGGHLAWAGAQEQALIGDGEEYLYAALLEFRRSDDALAFVDSSAHRHIASAMTALQVAALSVQPRAIALVSRVLAAVLPHWPFSSRIDPGEEPGVGTSSVMPTREALERLRGHARQDTPVVMVNWLRFREQAAYPPGHAPASGRDAYLRYGRVALTTTHSIGAKLVYAARFHQVLIGHGGDPAPKLWHEFALMQYPGRATFARMAALARYRRSLHHREAGLDERGQALIVTRPDAAFTWKG
jgi:hypothetical protein